MGIILQYAVQNKRGFRWNAWLNVVSKSCRICRHNRHPIARPHGRAMGCLLCGCDSGENWSRNNAPHCVKICYQLSIYSISQIGIDSLQWRNNGHDSVSNHQPHDCLLNRLFRRRSKKISKLRVTGLCAGNSPETGEFPAQMASNAENVSIWWRHHVMYDLAFRQLLLSPVLKINWD